MAREPAPGYEWGTVLPWNEIPEDLKCPWCSSGKVYKSGRALNGHSSSKHGVGWARPPEEIGKEIAAKRKLLRDPGDLEKLQPWHMLGLAAMEINDWDHHDAARHIGRPQKAKTLLKVRGSPAGIRYVHFMEEHFSDPVNLAKMMLQAQATDATVAFLTALKWAEEAHDYDAVHRMTKDLLKATGTLELADEAAVKPTINITIGKGQSLDIPEVEVEWEEVAKEEDEDDL